jgi:hypothetical protein
MQYRIKEKVVNGNPFTTLNIRSSSSGEDLYGGEEKMEYSLILHFIQIKILL